MRMAHVYATYILRTNVHYSIIRKEIEVYLIFNKIIIKYNILNQVNHVKYKKVKTKTTIALYSISFEIIVTAV